MRCNMIDCILNYLGANALALYRLGEDPRLMTTLVWIGVGMMAVAVVIALFVPRPTSFQMFIFRILGSLGAAGIGAGRAAGRRDRVWPRRGHHRRIE